MHCRPSIKLYHFLLIVNLSLSDSNGEFQNKHQHEFLNKSRNNYYFKQKADDPPSIGYRNIVTNYISKNT